VGKLIYGDSSMVIDIDDRPLAHLQIIIGAKLRRRECFFFSWKEDTSSGAGRGSVWLDPSVPLYFRYRRSKVPEINRAWIDVLMQSANSARGLEFIAEPGAQSVAPSGRI
jgi:hypothetical protein